MAYPVNRNNALTKGNNPHLKILNNHKFELVIQLNL